jgi:hypothetical protein
MTCWRQLVFVLVVVSATGVAQPLPPAGPLDVVTTELSPAVLVRSTERQLVLFDNTGAEVGGPTRLAVPTAQGIPKILHVGQGLDGTMQSRPWLLVWYAGAKGWHTWDVPMLVVLQHRATKLALAADGLHLSFSKQAGDIVVMPLHGFQKLPQAGADFTAFPARPPTEPGKWGKGLPEPVAYRCDRLSRISPAFPLHAKEEYAVEGDVLRMRTTIQFHRIRDDWGAETVPLAPLPPVLGLAWQANGNGDAEEPFPMRFPAPTDPKILTPYGPWLGIGGRESYTIDFPLLPYIQSTLATRDPAPETDPVAQAAQKRLRQVFIWKFGDGNWDKIWDHGSAKNFCWQAMGDRWYAKAIPFLAPEAQARVKRGLRGYMRDYVLQPERYKPYREVLQLFGPGIGAWGGYDDAGKFAANLLETLWNYAYYTGDTETIREHWPLIRKLFVTPYECDWKSFGRYSIAELGDEAAPAIAMARLAHLVGDTETSDFASYIAVRELVHHYAKSVGIGYFRRHQPWHSMDPVPERAWPTNLWGHTAGWQIDGPGYPERTRERQHTNRWVRFSDPDVGRFHRDVMPIGMALEMDYLAKEIVRDPKSRWRTNRDTAHIMPSLVRLRRLLLNDSPEKLAKIAPEAAWQAGRGADQAAFYLSFLGWRETPETTRLIPAHTSEFRLGLESTTKTHYPGLCLDVRAPKGSTAPVLSWEPTKGLAKIQGLRAPHLVQFGAIRPGQRPRQFSERVSLNWNTVVIRYR